MKAKLIFALIITCMFQQVRAAEYVLGSLGVCFCAIGCCVKKCSNMDVGVLMGHRLVWNAVNNKFHELTSRDGFSDDYRDRLSSLIDSASDLANEYVSSGIDSGAALMLWAIEQHFMDESLCKWSSIRKMDLAEIITAARSAREYVRINHAEWETTSCGCCPGIVYRVSLPRVEDLPKIDPRKVLIEITSEAWMHKSKEPPVEAVATSDGSVQVELAEVGAAESVVSVARPLQSVGVGVAASAYFVDSDDDYCAYEDDFHAGLPGSVGVVEGPCDDSVGFPGAVCVIDYGDRV